MKLRTIGAAGAGIALAASLLALGTSPASAAAAVHVSITGTDSATCGAVGDECRTIAQAIANVDEGGTIHVGAGVFTERVDITKPLTLAGAGREATIIGNGARQAAGPGQIRVGGGDNPANYLTGAVTIRDLRVHGTSSGSPTGVSFGIYLDSQAAPGSSTSISSVDVIGLGALGADYGLYCEGSGGDVDLGDMRFRLSDYNPVLIEACTGAVTIHDSDVEKTQGTAASAAIFSMNNFGTFSTGAQVVRDNEILGNVSFNTAWSGLGTGGYAGISVLDNVIAGGVSVSNQAQLPNAAASTISGAVIRGNTLLGSGTGNGVTVSGQVTGTVIEGNTVLGFANGVRNLLAAAGHGPSGTAVVANRIVGNDVAATSPDVPLYAENNWWGCNDVAGCATFVGDVDHEPHLVLTLGASPSTVGLNEPSTITAGVTTNSDGELAPGTFPAGELVPFATSLGTLSPAAVGLADRQASTVLTSPTAGTATVQATLDFETVSTQVQIKAPAPAAPPAPACKLIRLTVGIPLLGIAPIVICI